MKKDGYSLAHNATSWLRPRYSEGIGSNGSGPCPPFEKFDLVAQIETIEDSEMRALDIYEQWLSNLVFFICKLQMRFDLHTSLVEYVPQR